jgi:hypothetical protein
MTTLLPFSATWWMVRKLQGTAITRHGHPEVARETPTGAKPGADDEAQCRIAEIISPGIFAADGSASKATKRRMTS